MAAKRDVPGFVEHEIGADMGIEKWLDDGFCVACWIEVYGGRGGM